ncbi:MAG: hypothetical protein K0R14_483 [Burkholderiales bacterium]|jgi:hypothetical protein|nr:hypothetical protein [Burkholderiales bacterium]
MKTEQKKVDKSNKLYYSIGLFFALCMCINIASAEKKLLLCYPDDKGLEKINAFIKSYGMQALAINQLVWEYDTDHPQAKFITLGREATKTDKTGIFIVTQMPYYRKHRIPFIHDTKLLNMSDEWTVFKPLNDTFWKLNIQISQDNCKVAKKDKNLYINLSCDKLKSEITQNGLSVLPDDESSDEQREEEFSKCQPLDKPKLETKERSNSI